MRAAVCPKCQHEFYVTLGDWDIVGQARIAVTLDIAAKFKGPVVSPYTVDQYAQMMRDGTWDTHVAPLNIWIHGEMRNGFTRMAAVVKAGIPVEFDVHIIRPVDLTNQLRIVHQLPYMTPGQVLEVVRRGLDHA